METGEYETNSLLINNISCVTYRQYAIAIDQSQATPTAIQDVEKLLRASGFLVHFDFNHRVLWHFEVSNTSSSNGSSHSPTSSLASLIDIHGSNLSLLGHGSLEPISLLRSRLYGSNANNNSATSSGSPASAIESLSRPTSAFSASPSTPSWNVVDQSSKIPGLPNSDPKGSAAAAVREAYEHFVLAILATLSSALGEKVGAIPLDYRTILLGPDLSFLDGSTHIPTTACFRIYLTTTGSLVVSLAITASEGLSSLDSEPAPSFAPLGIQVLAAPLGILANYYGSPDGTLPNLDDGLAQTPDTQVLSFQDAKSSQWRQTCSKLLQLRGIPSSLLNFCPWVNIQISLLKSAEARSEKQHSSSPAMASISWPARLCFRKQATSSPPKNRIGNDVLVSQEESSFDPLSSARVWFQETPDRNDKLLKRKKEREIASASESADLDKNQAQNGQSPIALHRMGNANSGAMYPTPPDGVQNAVGVTPSRDGTVSSPTNQAPAVAIIDMDANIMNHGHIGDSDGDWAVPGEPKRERGEPVFLTESGPLFDDMGDDIFVDAELTDADFSFFDDQPSEACVLDGEDADVSDQPFPGAITAAPPDDPVPVPPDLGVKVKEQTPKFTKPELKHARSTLVEDGRPRTVCGRLAGLKRDSSPFNSSTVFKRVRASLATPRTGPRDPAPRKGSIFDKVDFDPVLPSVNRKYAAGGIFAYNWSAANHNAQIHASLPPTTEYLRHHGKRKRAFRPPANNQGTLIARITSGLEASYLHSVPGRISEDSGSDADDLSIGSDQDDMSMTSEEMLSPMKSSIKRSGLDDDTASQATSLRDTDFLDDSDLGLAVELPRLCQFEPQANGLTKYLSDPDPLPLRLQLADEDLVAVAQILTEQAAFGTLLISSDISAGHGQGTSTNIRRQVASLSRQLLGVLRDAIPDALGLAQECQLRGFAEVPDVPLLGPPTRLQLQPRPVPGRDPAELLLKPTSIYQISPPHLEVRRSDSKLSVLPSAIAFWETLGLGPYQGPKDVYAACVFTAWDGMVDNVDTFLDRLGSSYESLKLGTFERLPASGDLSNGLVPYDVDRISVTPGNFFPRISSALAERMDPLCQALTSCPMTSRNLVMFFIYSPSNPSSIVEACTAFHQLATAYRSQSDGRQSISENELVLQLVPLDYVSSSKSLVILSPLDLTRSSFEVYDRCSLFDFQAPSPTASSEYTLPRGALPSPAIVLEQLSPRLIDFKLSKTPSPSLLHENSCIHVAYAQSIDGRWISAAWTDSRGYQQTTASYCLGRKGKNITTAFNDVAHEIWETTHELISIWKVHWRVIITKCGPMDQHEGEFWAGLSQTETKASVSLLLLTVDTSPSLQLLPPAIKTTLMTTGGFHTTPVTTPQAYIVSPDQSGNPSTPKKDTTASASTPGGTEPTSDPDSEGVLVDITEQTWGAVLSHRLNNAASLVELNPALMSGYLIKRGGPRIEDPPVLMEVNVIYSDGSPRIYEQLLREMLWHFRSLGALSRARGVTDRDGDVRPWHVAAAEKSLKALYLLM